MSNLCNYGYEGFTPDLVRSKEQYGLRLWGREIVRVASCSVVLKDRPRWLKCKVPAKTGGLPISMMGKFQYAITRRPGYAYLHNISLMESKQQ